MNRLLVEPKHCFKGLLLLLLMASVGFTTSAEESADDNQSGQHYQLTAEDLKMIQAGQDILEQQSQPQESDETQQLIEQAAAATNQPQNNYQFTAEDLQLIEQGQQLKKNH